MTKVKSTNSYKVLKEKHQKEWNEFPVMFAFSNEQFKEGMEKLGLTEDDTDKIYSIGAGGYIRKTDSKALKEMIDKHDKGMKEAIESDLTGEGFIYDMFDYELANHEYGYTGDSEPAIEALGLTMEEIYSSEKLLNGLKKAKNNQW